jgi:hypothetical protein
MSSENTFINDLHEDTNNPYSTHITKNELLVIQQSIKWDNGSWTPEEKKVLHSKMSRCFILKESHWEIARRCAKRYKLINFPKVICSTILASSLTLFTQQEQENKLFVYFNAVLSVFVAILTTSSSFLDYNVQKARHRSSSLGYGKLAVYIDRVLRLPPDERETFGDTLAKVNEEYASLRTEAPFLNTQIVRKYTKIYRPPETESRIQIPLCSVMQTDNTYHSGLCCDPSHKKGIIDHIMKKTKLTKKSNQNIGEENMDYTCVENEEYFTEIIDSNEEKAKRLDKVLRPIIGPEIEPELVKTTAATFLQRPLPSPIMRDSPKLNSPKISRSDSNNSVYSVSKVSTNSSTPSRSSPIPIPTCQDSLSNEL